MVDYSVVDSIALHTVEVGDMLRIGGEDFSVEQIVDKDETIMLALLDSNGEDDEYIGDPDEMMDLLAYVPNAED